MREPPPQFSLKVILSVTAAVAYHMALCSYLLRGNLPGFVATLFAHAMVWFAIACYRLHHWADVSQSGSGQR